MQGWRYHMSDINASIGIIQLKRFSKLSRIRKNICKSYDKKFRNHEFIKTFKRNYKEEVPHIYVIRVLGLKNREFKKKLLKKEFRQEFTITRITNILNLKTQNFYSLIRNRFIKNY